MPDGSHVNVITLGGTIDKDYPQLTAGYAFEFGDESAAHRVLRSHPNLGFKFSISQVCQKDSLEITDEDRSNLVSAMERILDESKTTRPDPGERIVITHGTDTMIETALYVEEKLGSRLARSVVAFTGATKPERFKDSDASFNLGAAVSATSICPPGSVVICMNGNVTRASECSRRDDGIFKCVRGSQGC